MHHIKKIKKKNCEFAIKLRILVINLNYIELLMLNFIIKAYTATYHIYIYICNKKNAYNKGKKKTSDFGGLSIEAKKRLNELFVKKIDLRWFDSISMRRVLKNN